jgi:hypothetical protein
MTAPVLGQTVIVKIASSPLREVPAIVSLVTDEDTINAVGQIDINDDWPSNGPGATHPGYPFFGITRGSGLNQWRDADVPVTTMEAIDDAGYASEIYVDNAQAVCQALPSAGSSQVSLGLNAARRPSTTRPVRVSATGQISLTSTLLGAKVAAVSLLSDASNPPTTNRGIQQFNLSGVAATVSPPWSLSYEVPVGHYYMLATSGADAAGVSLATLQEQTL